MVQRIVLGHATPTRSCALHGFADHAITIEREEAFGAHAQCEAIAGAMKGREGCIGDGDQLRETREGVEARIHCFTRNAIVHLIDIAALYVGHEARNVAHVFIAGGARGPNQLAVRSIVLLFVHKLCPEGTRRRLISRQGVQHRFAARPFHHPTGHHPTGERHVRGGSMVARECMPGILQVVTEVPEGPIANTSVGTKDRKCCALQFAHAQQGTPLP